MGVTNQRDALAVGGQPAGLFDGHEGLAATGAAADLNPVEQSGGAEDYGLMVGEDVGRILIFQRAGHDVALREPAPA